MKQLSHKALESTRADVISLNTDRGASAKRGANWGFLLLLFMRVIAGLWMMRGLLHWKTILTPDLTPFEALPFTIAACVVFFAVSDIIAAVGLWLASAWGGVLWLFSTAASIIITMAIPEFHAGGRILLVIDFALIVVYFVLTWFVANTRET